MYRLITKKDLHHVACPMIKSHMDNFLQFKKHFLVFVCFHSTFATNSKTVVILLITELNLEQRTRDKPQSQSREAECSSGGKLLTQVQGMRIVRHPLTLFKFFVHYKHSYF